jgi:hypothetical protein
MKLVQIRAIFRIQFILISKYCHDVTVTYKRGLGWMTGFIAPYTFTQFGTTGNTALSLFYTLSSSPLHTH